MAGRVRYHDELAALMARYPGRTCTAREVKQLFHEAYPDLDVQWVQASDHCIDRTNKEACDCALSERAIFRRPAYNTYVVR